jgi:hypothetical protein
MKDLLKKLRGRRDLIEVGASVRCLSDAHGHVYEARGVVVRWTKKALVLDSGVVFLSHLLIIERCKS